MAGRRHSARRAVALECTLLSELWDGEVQLSATNLSEGGIWIETAIAPEPGEELVVSFSPPGAEQVWAAARVVRVGPSSARAAPSAASPQGIDLEAPADASARWGMALEFTRSSERQVRLLAQALRGSFRPAPRAALEAVAQDDSTPPPDVAHAPLAPA